MQLLLELGTNTVLIDCFKDRFPQTVRLHAERRRTICRGAGSQISLSTSRAMPAARAIDGQTWLVSNDSKTYKAELTFEFRRLTQVEVDALEAIYRGREHFICIPDPIDEPEKVYIVRWVSPFDRRDTVVTDWSQGRNLQAVFREV